MLAEKGGVSRADFLGFLNDSVMGSTFTRYKSPAYVNLDFSPTFTPELLLKDFHLGFEAARSLDVPMPLAAATEQIVQSLEGIKGNEVDFAALLELSAAAARSGAAAGERRGRRWALPTGAGRERRSRRSFRPPLGAARARARRRRHTGA